MISKIMILFFICFQLNIALSQQKVLHFDNIQYSDNSFVSLNLAIAEDTCINNLRYQFIGVNTRDIPDYRFKYYIRFDSSKVFLLYSGNNQEYLLYNYGAKKGDTIDIYPPKGSIFTKWDSLPDSKQSKIVKLDTTILYNDTYRRTIFFENDTLKWVEGLGSLNSIFLDPFGKDRGTFNYNLVIYYFHDSSIIVPQSFKKMYSGYSYNFNLKNPFYFVHNCLNNTIQDTVQLDTSECRRPYTFQNFTIKQSAYNNTCRDTVKLSLDIKYVPPTFTYKFVPDSFVVLKPPYDSMKTTLYTYVSNASCNKKITYYPTHNCIVCKDSVYKPFLISDQPKDTLYCPDTLNHTYTIKGGNFDTSFSWKFLNPVPLIYGNTMNYPLKVVAQNQFCKDTFVIDTLNLICEDSCKFKQLPCINISCNKLIATRGDTLNFTNSCNQNCIGYQSKWDNDKAVEILPENYLDTVFTKRLTYWNNFGTIWSSSIQVKVDLKSKIESRNSDALKWEIREDIVYLKNIDGNIEVTVYNNMGFKVLKVNNTNIIKLNHLPPGIYHILFKGVNNSTSEKVMVGF